MTNKDIAGLLRFGAKLLDLHNENAFKVKSYESAAYRIERMEEQLRDFPSSELEKVEGIGSALARKIEQILSEGTYNELEKLKELTPEGLIEILGLKGLGAKKVRVLWQELDVNSLEDLYEACNTNKVSGLKGFGAKTQSGILSGLKFMLENRGKALYMYAEAEALYILEFLKGNGINGKLELTGNIRRKEQVIDRIEILAGMAEKNLLEELLDREFKGAAGIRWCSPVRKIPIEVRFSSDDNFAKDMLISTGSEKHLSLLGEVPAAPDEKSIYEKLKLQFIEPEMREGINEIELAKAGKLPELITMEHIKGCLHNHSHYSDGKSSLEQMVKTCVDAGYEYFGISDHSQSAAYAGGLKPEKLEKQKKEVDKLNIQNAPFKVLWGIESDILSDGSLDYPDEILGKFDYIVASIHSGFNMTKEQATQRLIKAVENPYTSILGHMTGRLLLIREGYPVDVKKVIDACVANKVAVEINSNPRRLDVDWTYLHYAMDKGAMLSINPDAHHIDEVKYMYYGICVARKAGVSPHFVLNTKPLQEVEAFFNKN